MTEDRENSFDLSADRPSIDPANDRLGYAAFARRIAQSILNLAGSDGHVIAIYGPWGFGKTTMLNYVRSFIAEAPEPQRPVVVEFNPWWFSGGEDLIGAFFGQLQSQLSKLRQFSRESRKKLADLADLVSEVPLPHNIVIKPIAKALRPKPKDISRLKGEISETLRKQKTRILVVIDDIDRLTSEEIREVFRAVKAVADFPNVTYLLAFDRAVVTRSLRKLQGGSGNDYLEKIVQIPFELPLTGRLAIRTFFFERLNLILSGVQESDFDQTYWGNVFYECIDKFLKSPRDVVRFTNTLSVTFRAVMSEVNVIDFIVIESLRIFCPEVYETVKNNPEMFTGNGAIDHARQREGLNAFHDKWLSELREKSRDYEKPIAEMLKRVFPKLQSIWGNTTYGPEWESDWRRNLKVCSGDIFPVYFSLAVRTGEISNAEMKAILEELGDREKLSAKLLHLAKQLRPDGKTRANAFLDRLEDYTGEIDIGLISNLVAVFLDIGDRLIVPSDEGAGLIETGNEVQIGRLNWQLLKRLSPDERFRVLKQSFETGQALSILQRAIIVLGQQQGLYGEPNPHPESEWLVTREQLYELERILLSRIREASRTGHLLDSPGLLFLLGWWREKAGDEAKVWVSAVTTSDDALVTVVEMSLRKSSSLRFTDRVSQHYDRLDPQWLEPYLDIDRTAARLRRLESKQDLTSKQKRAIDRFLKEYDMRKKVRIRIIR